MERILLGHGSGGKLMHQLIAGYFAPHFGMDQLGDSAILDAAAFQGREGRLAYTTDSYVVSPLFFPGGSIGELAVNGTVNDLAMVGATPVYLTTGFIIEEGFPFADLKRVLQAMASAANEAGVRIVAGDTKVVEKGKGDGLFINTSGVGIIPPGIDLGPRHILPGDRVVISGAIGNHGIAVLAERNGLSFDPPVVSDTAPLADLVRLMTASTNRLRMMRDPTRGGVATTLKEMALDSRTCIQIDEAVLPVPGGVHGACELLGLDPLFVANEGILLAIVGAEDAEALVRAMQGHPRGGEARVIGDVTPGEGRREGMVLMKTRMGGTRIIDMLSGEQLPRIC